MKKQTKLFWTKTQTVLPAGTVINCVGTASAEGSDLHVNITRPRTAIDHDGHGDTLGWKYVTQ